MHFYALRVECQSCNSSFVVGGSAENDLSLWRDSLVECRHCGRQTPAAAGETVSLGSAVVAAETPERELCHA